MDVASDLSVCLPLQFHALLVEAPIKVTGTVVTLTHAASPALEHAALQQVVFLRQRRIALTLTDRSQANLCHATMSLARLYVQQTLTVMAK